MNVGVYLQIVGACIVLASIPATAWGYVFYLKQKEERFPLMITFLLGAFAVLPILFYKWLWQFYPNINILSFANQFRETLVGFEGFVMIPLSIIVTFAIVGVIEEIMKIGVVHAVDDNRIRHIDDAMEFSIFAALGFAFTENILYFYTIWHVQGADHLFVPFLFRSIFSTFAHLLFSGIFGYYYGIAHFASPILMEEIRSGRSAALRFFHRIFKRNTAAMFHREKLLEGFLFAVVLHAIYNIFLEMNWSFFMVPYLVLGYMVLTYLLEKKENHKQYKLLLMFSRNHEREPGRVARHVSRVFQGK